jgi:hypothetical protein
VNHPGGRSFDTYPVNSFEAESRKMSRFGILATLLLPLLRREIGKEAISNQAATSRFLVESKSELKPDTPIELINPEYPYTLDLRHYWKAKK